MSAPISTSATSSKDETHPADDAADKISEGDKGSETKTVVHPDDGSSNNSSLDEKALQTVTSETQKGLTTETGTTKTGTLKTGTTEGDGGTTDGDGSSSDAEKNLTKTEETVLGSIRIIQWILAAVILGLSGKLKEDSTSLTSLASDINALTSELNATLILRKRDDFFDDSKFLESENHLAMESENHLALESENYLTLDSETLLAFDSENDLSLDSENHLAKRENHLAKRGTLDINTNWKASALSMLASALTVFAHPALSIIPNKYLKKEKNGILRILEQEAKLSKTEIGVLSSLTTSELGSNALYFASFIYQATEYGSYDCTGVSQLIMEYNLTSPDFDEQNLMYFFGLYEDDSSTTATNSSNLNMTVILEQTKLLLSLEKNCELKKANIALSAVNWFSFMYSTLVVGKTAKVFHKKTKAHNKKVKAVKDAAAAKAKKDAGGLSASTMSLASTDPEKQPVTQKFKHKRHYRKTLVFPEFFECD